MAAAIPKYRTLLIGRLPQSRRLKQLSPMLQVRGPEFARGFPFEEELSKALHRRRVFIFLPDENQRDTLDGLEQNEMERGRRRHNRFSDNPNAGACFDVAHHGADKTRRVSEARSDTSLAATRDDCVVKSDALAAREDDERFAGEGVPRNRPAFGKG